MPVSTGTEQRPNEFIMTTGKIPSTTKKEKRSKSLSHSKMDFPHSIPDSKRKGNMSNQNDNTTKPPENQEIDTISDLMEHVSSTDCFKGTTSTSTSTATVAKENLSGDKIESFDIAERLSRECLILAISEQELLYVYHEKDGSFIPYSHKGFSTFLFQQFSNPSHHKLFTNHFSKEVFHFLVNAPELQVSMDDFNNAEEYLLNVKNGVLDVQTLKLLPHDPKYRFTYTYQVDFKKFAGFPPKFACFLRDCFENNADRTRCLEALGYTLSGNKTSKTIWFFVGVVLCQDLKQIKMRIFQRKQRLFSKPHLYH